MNRNVQFEWKMLGAWGYIEHRAWDADWEQVIVFLAGKLAGSPDLERELLDCLTNVAFDPVSRKPLDLVVLCPHEQQLGVAAMCLGEIPPSARPPVSEQIDRIREVAFLMYISDIWGRCCRFHWSALQACGVVSPPGRDSPDAGTT